MGSNASLSVVSKERWERVHARQNQSTDRLSVRLLVFRPLSLSPRSSSIFLRHSRVASHSLSLSFFPPVRRSNACIRIQFPVVGTRGKVYRVSSQSRRLSSICRGRERRSGISTISRACVFVRYKKHLTTRNSTILYV